MNLDFGDDEHAGERLRHWLLFKLDALDMTVAELSAALGYERPNTVAMWLEGRAKIPLRKLPELAEALIADPAVLIGLFLDQEFSNEPDLREQLVKASSRVVPEWEYGLVVAARLVYISGDDSWYTYMPDYAA